MPDDRVRSIGPVGTTARALIGAALIGSTVVLEGVRWGDVFGALVVLPAVALAVATAANVAMSGSVLRRRSRVPWSAAQVGVACGLVVAVIAIGTALTFVTPLNAGSILYFFGASMLLASVLGYDGCEMLALPNVVLGRRDAIWCPLYVPFDAVDAASDRD